MFPFRLAAALAAMVLTATPALAQSSGSNVWLEGGRATLWGCGSNYETTLRIRASGGRFYCLSQHQRSTWSPGHPGRDIFKCESASVTLRLRSGVSASGNLLQVSDEPGRWIDFDSGTLVLTITHGLKTIGVRAKAGATIPVIGTRKERLGLRGWQTNTANAFFFSRAERWVFELQDNSGKGDYIGGQTYGGIETLPGGRTINYGTRSPGIGIWVMVPGWRNSTQHGFSPSP